MAAGKQVASLRDGIMPELYAISAEDRRRTEDPEDAPLDSEEHSTFSSAQQTIADFGIAMSTYGAPLVNDSVLYSLMIALATDAAEIARRIRPH